MFPPAQPVYIITADPEGSRDLGRSFCAAYDCFDVAPGQPAHAVALAHIPAVASMPIGGVLATRPGLKMARINAFRVIAFVPDENVPRQALLFMGDFVGESVRRCSAARINAELPIPVAAVRSRPYPTLVFGANVYVLPKSGNDLILAPPGARTVTCGGAVSSRMGTIGVGEETRPASDAFTVRSSGGRHAL